MDRILVCNSSKSELEQLQLMLDGKFNLRLMSEWTSGKTEFNDVDCILIDANFTENLGLDFLMEVNARCQLATLFIAPVDDPHCAIEANRIGASSYLVKTDKLHFVLGLALPDAIARFKDREEMKRTILSQRNRIADLEKELAKSKRPSVARTASGVENSEQRLLEAIVDQLRKGEVNLPAYPPVSAKFAKLMRGGAGIGDAAKLLKEDMAIAAKLIGVSNSPRYRGARPNVTVEQAITALGLSETKNYVELIANRALFVTKSPSYKPALNALWKHSIACAHASQAVAEAANMLEFDEVFTMALVHDIGTLQLLQVIAELDQTQKATLANIELDGFLQRNHGFFGKKILELWRLPQKFSEVARYHDAPGAAPAVTDEMSAVHLGDIIATKIGFGTLDGAHTEADALPSVERLKLNLSDLIAVEDKVRRIMNDGALVVE